jgi:hypothetical protein
VDLRDEARAPLLASADDLSKFVQTVFAPLPRADQRRWAEIYIRGLLSAWGRKTVPNIAVGVEAPDAVQSLQQFVSQSPWDWAPVRARLVEQALAKFEPDAWVVQAIHIPKRGMASVGVTRRFVPAAGRIMTCQMALGMFAASAHNGVPANWRIVLPPPWLSDEIRRKAGIPDGERGETEWKCVLDMVDEMTGDWRLPSPPVVVDMRRIDGVLPLAAGLEARGVPYVLRVSSGLQVVPVAEIIGPADGSGRPLMPVGSLGSAEPVGPPGWSGPVGEASFRAPTASLRVDVVGARTDPRRRDVVTWLDVQVGTVRRSPVRVVLVRLAGPPSERATSRLVAVWSGEARMPSDYLLTNLPHDQLARVLSLSRLPAVRRVDIDTLTNYGLVDFEGRTYRGWHHHATLVSAALGYERLSRVAFERATA